jgi:hypothetical protein
VRLTGCTTGFLDARSAARSGVRRPEGRAAAHGSQKARYVNWHL